MEDRMLLEKRTFLVKERVAFAKLTDTYDILDPDNGQTIGIAKEEPSPWAKYLRLIVNKHLMPTIVNFYEQEGAAPVLSIRRGAAFFRPKVMVTSGSGQNLGYFQAKALSLGPSFRVFDSANNEVAVVKGDWKGWNFQLTTSTGQQLGTVTKKWAGIGKELFTSADNYVIAINDTTPNPQQVVPLLLAAGIAIDTVFKEQK
jgi:uncharacterized protein YxjI